MLMPKQLDRDHSQKNGNGQFGKHCCADAENHAAAGVGGEYVEPGVAQKQR